MVIRKPHKVTRWVGLLASGVVLLQVPSCVTDTVNLAIRNTILAITADVLQTVFLNLLHT